MTRFARKFRKVGRSLSRVELMRSSMDETFALTQQDLVDKDGGRRFLDFYGDEGLRIAFEKYGFYDAIRDKGWDHFTIETWAHDERHTLLIDGRPAGGGERERLVELSVRRDRLVIEPPKAYREPMDRGWEVLTVDWLSLRNPIGHFTEDRMRLPGQDAPGLGVGEQVLELLYRVVDRLSLDGLVTVAEYFHNAVLYARELPYVDPFYQGQLEAFEALLFEREKLSFAQAAWAMHWGFVVGPGDEVVPWKGQAMIQTEEKELTAYLRSPVYADCVDKARRELRYRLRRSAFDEKWAAWHERLLEPPAPDEDPV